jgi:hypothetical protein
LVLNLLVAALLMFTGSAHAGPATTRDSLDRLQEVLELRIDEGSLVPGRITPAILVSAQPRYEASQDWFATQAIEILHGTLGAGSLRLCEACMAPRTVVENGHLLLQTGPVSIDEVVRLDEQSRGDSKPARSAIWVNEHQGGVSVRIVDLATSQVIFAQNIDPGLVENANSERMYALSEELERRARGDSLTQAFVDVALFPGQHISLDWTDQWGATNANLSGVSLSIIDPLVGIGAVHYRRIKLLNTLVGGKILLSLPTAIVQSVGDGGDAEALDPLVTGVGLVRVPFGRSNYGGVMSLSTNGEFGLGISLMNVSLLPFLP